MKYETTQSQPQALSTLAVQIIVFGKQRGWDFKHLGRAPFPDRHIRVGDWLIVPAHQDTSLIPPRAQQRVRALNAAGLYPTGWVVVHEAPHLLPAPAPEIRPETNPIPWKRIAVTGGKVVMKGVIALAKIAAFSSAAVFVSALGIAALLDPILVAVTLEGDWIEIDRWID